MPADLTARARRAIHASGVARGVREAHLTELRWRGRLSASLSDDNRSRGTGSPARVLGYTPSYLPESRAGSETTLHAILTGLEARGYRSRVLVDAPGARTYAVEGIEVTVDQRRREAARLFRWADVVIAQLGTRNRAIRLAARWGRPLAFYVQLGGTPQSALFGQPDLDIFNSDFVRSQYPWITDGLVFHPPIDCASYRTEPGDEITLVNLAELKGGSLFWALAERLPDRRFLGVKGWGTQVIPDRLPANVTVLEPTDDMRSVYARTRVLLMPSQYESYGRVALEAACSGIPTIGSRTGGLQEALGDAALWADRADIESWVSQLELLDDASAYAARSRLVCARAESLDPESELDALERRLLALSSWSR